MAVLRNRPASWILFGLILVLLLTALVEYNEVLTLERRPVTTSTTTSTSSVTSTFSVTSNQTITVSSVSILTVTSQILVDVSGTSSVTVTQQQIPSSMQTCTAQTNSLGPCYFHQDGTPDIAGLPQFYYLDITAVGAPSRFNFEGVAFNGTTSDNYCPSGACTGPAEDCIAYSARIIKTNASYNIDDCSYEVLVASSATVFLYPQNLPQVGLMWLPDGTVFALVATTL